MTDPANRRTQAQRRATTEKRLLEAATRLFAERGSRSVSIADVGAAAGYSRGIVTQHFGGRSELLAAVVLHAQQFEVDDPEGASGLDRVTNLVRAYLDHVRADRSSGQAFLLLWTEAIAADPVLAPLFAERDRWFRQLLADRLRQGVDDGSIRGDVDPPATAATLVAVLRGIGLQLMAPAPPVAFVRVTADAVAFVRHGLAS